MFVASFILAGLAIALAWPVPILLARASWPDRAPATALLVWQAIALAGGLSMIGAMLTFGLVPFGDNLATGLAGFWMSLVTFTIPAGANFLQTFALAGAILLGVHLLLNLVTTFVKAERLRRRHQQLVALLGHPVPSRESAVRMIDEPAPVAYCLPGTTHSITVLSAGLLELLDGDQLTAVIAHEEAHGLQRHHLVLLAFRAWRRSLPWFPIATRANEAVAILVELLADDHARRVVAPDVVAESIAAVGAGAPTPQPSDVTAILMLGRSESRSTATRRVARLVQPGSPLSLAGRLLAVMAAILLLACPTALLVIPIFVA